MVSRRTVTVWFCLFFSLTAVSSLLFALEPAPVAPTGGTISLLIPTTAKNDINQIFDSTKVPLNENRWDSIVIHHSGQPFGNKEIIGHQHQAEGKNSLGYHFVIGNGDQAVDGELQTGIRWVHQVGGDHVKGKNAAYLNQRAIAICLVGDFDTTAPTESQMLQLRNLVHALQRRCKITKDRVYLHYSVAQTTSPGRFFPSAAFRRELLN